MASELKKADFVKMGDAKPIRDIPILLLQRGNPAPKFARYSTEGLYSIQGYFGLHKAHDDDFWLDISDLLKEQ